MVSLLVIMQRSKLFAYSKCHHKKKGKRRSHLELTSMRNERAMGEANPAGKWMGSENFFEGGIYQGSTSWDGPVDSKQVLSVMFSYPIMCLWYVWCSLTLLMAALWYHQERWETQLSRHSTSIFHCNFEGEYLTGPRQPRKKNAARLSLQHKHRAHEI